MHHLARSSKTNTRASAVIWNPCVDFLSRASEGEEERGRLSRQKDTSVGCVCTVVYAYGSFQRATGNENPCKHKVLCRRWVNSFCTSWWDIVHPVLYLSGGGVVSPLNGVFTGFFDAPALQGAFF